MSSVLPSVVTESREYDRYPGEHRSMAALTDAVMRDASGTGDGTYTFTGVAVVYDQWTTLYEGDMLGERIRIRERVATGALTGVLAGGPEVHFNHGHDMRTSMARLQVVGEYGDVRRGGMKLWEDDRGLNVFARLNPVLSHVRDLHAQMEDGIVDQMSFAFRIGSETMDRWADGEQDDPAATVVYDYTINEVSELFDVCACAQGAYRSTSAQMRDAIMASSRHGRDMVPVGDAAVTPPVGGPPPGLMARARAARFKYQTQEA